MRYGHPNGLGMDQQDGISRRDAVIGVSFLGVLMAALSATIVYRIVDTQPPKGPRKAPLITVTPPVASFDGEVETVAHETPVATSANNHANISDGSTTPTFVAPSGR